MEVRHGPIWCAIQGGSGSLACETPLLHTPWDPRNLTALWSWTFAQEGVLWKCELIDFESKGVRRLKSIYVYTPRALVTVEDEDSFGNRTKHIRCAYEDGVPQVSSEFNFGGGPYRGGAVWDAEIVALAWGKDPLRDCWVRTQSQSQSVHGGFCGLSMTIPGTFQEKARGDMHFMSILFYSCTIFNVLLFTTVGYIFWSRILKGVKKGLKRLRKAIERMLKALRRKLRSACTQSSESSEEENLIGTWGCRASTAPKASTKLETNPSDKNSEMPWFCIYMHWWDGPLFSNSSRKLAKANSFWKRSKILRSKSSERNLSKLYRLYRPHLESLGCGQHAAASSQLSISRQKILDDLKSWNVGNAHL